MVQEIEKTEVRKEKVKRSFRSKPGKTRKTEIYRTQTPILYHIFRIVVVGEVAVLIFFGSIVEIARNHKVRNKNINFEINSQSSGEKLSLGTFFLQYPPSMNLLATDESVEISTKV